jgi:beta-lactamase regulating signal transducer with metallopeptidase domain
MSFVDFSSYQAEALIVCLAASIAWAGALFVAARRMECAGAMRSVEKLWAAALLFAVLPSLIAPTLAAFGVSLRPAAAQPIAMERTAVAPRIALDSAPATSFDAAALSSDQLTGAAAVIYAYGAFLALLLWAARSAGLYYAIARAEPETARALRARLNDWADRLGVALPDIRRSRHVSSVCIFGVFRQTILIPDGLDARVSTDDLVLMCAHELAHVKRGDTKLFTVTQLARALFWFNPLVGKIAAQAELAAEQAADALVLAKGVDRRRYAACFVEGLRFAAWRTGPQPALAPSFTPADRRGRRRRLDAILSPRPERRTPLGRRLALSAAASALALAAVGQAALAVDPESGAERQRSVAARAEADRSADAESARSAKVIAPADGVVVEAADRARENLGKVLVIDHGHGRTTRFSNLDSLGVRKGDEVKAGDVIATADRARLRIDAAMELSASDGAIAAAPAAAARAPVELAPSSPEPETPAAPPNLPVAAAAPNPTPPKPLQLAFALPLAVPTPLLEHPIELTFSHGDAMAALMADDLEDRLLGALDEHGPVGFNMTLDAGGKVYQFKSGDTLTPEERREIREALADARRERERAMKELLERQKEWRRQAAEARREAERQALRFKDWSRQLAFDWEDDSDGARAAFEESRRQALEERRLALEEAQSDLEEAVEEGIDEALADLEDAELDLDDPDMSEDEKRTARAAIAEARRELERNGQARRRALEQARSRLEAERAHLDQMLEELEHARRDH